MYCIDDLYSIDVGFIFGFLFILFIMSSTSICHTLALAQIHGV